MFSLNNAKLSTPVMNPVPGASNVNTVTNPTNVVAKPTGLKAKLMASSTSKFPFPASSTPVVKTTGTAAATAAATPTTSSATATTALVKAAPQGVIIAPTASTITKLAQDLIAQGGRKLSTPLVNKMATFWTAYTFQELQDMCFACKKYSFKSSDFDQVVERSLKLSEANLKSVGVSDELIQKSAPRVNYNTKATAIKAIMKKYFWDNGMSDKQLSWANFVRIPDVETFLKECRKYNQTFKPGNAQLIFSNAYWMVATWEEAKLEMDMRTLLAIVAIQKLAPMFQLNEIGQVTDVATEGWGEYMAEIGESGWSDITTAAEAKSLLASLSPITLAAIVQMIDVRKLMQCKSFRMTRNNNSYKKEHNTMLVGIVNRMKMVILGARYLKQIDGVDYAADDTKVDPKSAFCQEYFESYRFIHTFIRSMKLKLFGKAGGAATRDTDYVGIQTKSFEEVWAEVSINEFKTKPEKTSSTDEFVKEMMSMKDEETPTEELKPLFSDISPV